MDVYMSAQRGLESGPTQKSGNYRCLNNYKRGLGPIILKLYLIPCSCPSPAQAF